MPRRYRVDGTAIPHANVSVIAEMIEDVVVADQSCLARGGHIKIEAGFHPENVVLDSQGVGDVVGSIQLESRRR